MVWTYVRNWCMIWGVMHFGNRPVVRLVLVLAVSVGADDVVVVVE